MHEVNNRISFPYLLQFKRKDVFGALGLNISKMIPALPVYLVDFLSLAHFGN
jgi:hypothetical protein